MICEIQENISPQYQGGQPQARSNRNGFIIDDERLKNLGGGSYRREFLQRIRDIRTSEKVFYRTGVANDNERPGSKLRKNI